MAKPKAIENSNRLLNGGWSRAMVRKMRPRPPKTTDVQAAKVATPPRVCGRAARPGAGGVVAAVVAMPEGAPSGRGAAAGARASRRIRGAAAKPMYSGAAMPAATRPAQRQ